MIEINSGLVNHFGIILDIIGAFFLAESFILKNDDKLLKESASFYDGNPYLLVSNSIQRFEARTGFIFLALGFAMQFIAKTDFVVQGENMYVWQSLVAGMLLGLFSFIIIKNICKKSSRNKIIKSDGENFIKSLNESLKDSEERFIKIAKFYGDVINMKQYYEESDSDYAIRTNKYIDAKLTIIRNKKSLFQFLNYYWRKKYKQLIIFGSLFLIIIVSTIELIADKKGPEIIYHIILIITAAVIFWYSRETADLKDISNKSIKELRKQVFLEQRPFIRLQWIGKSQNQLSGIRIINEGSGVAVNLKIESDGKPEIKRSIVAGEKASKSYTDAGFQDASLGSDEDFETTFSPSNTYELSVVYGDIAGNKYVQKFTTNNLLNDKFELTEWDMPEEFEKIKFKKINIS